MITSITVTYKPDLASLRRQLENLRFQVQSMLIVDNGPAGAERDALANVCERIGATLIPLESNTGIAFAQNMGIQRAIMHGAQWVLLMDQDSDPAAGAIGRLHNALLRHPHAAAAGPSTYDERTGRSFYFLLDFVKGLWPTIWSPSGETLPESIEVALLIASGTLIRTSAFDSADPMLANWFIDHVDSEWCFRTRSQGWSLLGVPSAKLHHRLGDKVSVIWFLRWRQVAHHSPLRDYYMFRNSILLAKKPYVNWHWKYYIVARMVLFAGFFLVFTPSRLSRLKMMSTGIWHGLTNRVGAWK